MNTFKSNEGCKSHPIEENLHYETITDAIKDLICRGYTIDFNLQENYRLILDEEFEIEDIYRYEGNTDPADEAMVCAIKTSSGLKGMFVTGYGTYSDPLSYLLFGKMKNSRHIR